MIDELTPAELAAARAELDRTRDQFTVKAGLVVSRLFWQVYLVECMAALLVEIANDHATDLVAAARHCLALRQVLTDEAVQASRGATP